MNESARGVATTRLGWISLPLALPICCGVALLLVAPAAHAQAQPQPPKPAEKPAAKKSAAKEPAHAQRVATREPTEQDLAEIRAFLDRVLKVHAQGDSLSFGQMFDGRRMLKEMGRQGALTGKGLWEIIALRLGMEMTLRFGPAVFDAPSGDRANSYRLGRVFVSSDGNEAQVFVQFTGAGEPWWQSLWLARRPEPMQNAKPASKPAADQAPPLRWRVFDSQPFETARRLTTSTAEVYSHDATQRQAHVRAKQFVDQYQAQQGYIDEAQARRVQKKLETARMHPATRARWQLYEGQWALLNDEPKQALEWLAKARQQELVRSIVPYYEAEAYFELDQFEPALAAAQEFLANVGDDPRMRRIAGESLLKLKRPEEAAAEYRAGLAADPNNVGLLVSLAGVLPKGKKAEIAEHFRKLSAPVESFNELITELHSENDAEAMLAVLPVYRQLAPDAHDADYYEAMARLIEGKYDDAAKLLRLALSKVNEDHDREYYISSYYQAMVGAGKAIEAYRESDDPRESYRRLGAILESTKAGDPNQPKELRALTEAHRAKFPRDPYLSYYLGGVLGAEKKYDEADQILAEGMRTTVEAATLELLRERRVSVAFQAGKGTNAYDEIRPRRATFAQLAALYSQTDAAQPLAALVEKHAKADPADPALAYWQTESAWLSKNYDQVIKLAALGDETTTDEPQGGGQFRRNELMLRSLVRLKRFDEAEQLAARLNENGGQEQYVLIVAAAMGRVQTAMKLARICVEDYGYDADFFYQDPDLGPPLHGKAFAKFRELYPPPAKDKKADENSD